MQNKKMANENMNKGITLIALSITIVVLLILSGISIATLTGDNGLINKTSEAKRDVEKSDAREMVDVQVSNSYNKFGELDKDILNRNLENIEGISQIPIKDFPAEVIVDGYKITIESNGRVTSEKDPVIETTPPTTAVKDKTIFKDPNSGNKEAVIPKGFRVSGVSTEQKIDKGLVVIAPDGSEFVWVPVDKTTLCAAGVEGKEVAEISSGTDYRGVLYSFSGTTSSKKTYSDDGYREPEVLTDPDNNADGADTNEDYLAAINNIIGTEFSTSDDFKEYMQDEYNDIIDSIKTNGGFYVGRYESSLSSSTNTVAGTTGNIQSKKEIMPTLSNNSGTNMWYGLYAKQRVYAQNLTGANVKSSMIYGSMYDAVMNWVLYGDDKTDASKVTASSTKHGVEYTGALNTDKINNIYDLGNNLREWTTEASDTYFRIWRGGCCNNTDEPSNRVSSGPDYANSYTGSRLLLYM